MRQAQQDQDEELRHELDQELDSLRLLLYAPDASSSNDGPAAPVLESAAMKLDEKDQEYDQFVRELVFEKRAKPKDRTKTEEELALEEKEALEKAERRRIRRMNGEESDTEDEEGDGTKKSGKRRARGGDDLEDDFMKEDTFEDGLGAGLGDMAVDAASSDEEDQESDGDEVESDEDEDETDETGGAELMVSDEDDDDEDDDEEPEELIKSSEKQSSKKQTSSAAEELPFTFPCPSSHDEFLDIVENFSDDDVPTVVKRIRALHHPSLAEDNKFKLQVCTDVIKYRY